MTAWEFQQMQNIAEKNGWHKFISMQNYMNLLYREEEREMIRYCQDTGVGIIPWSPISRGVLARPWKAEVTKRQETDQNALPGADCDEKIVSRVEEISKKRGVTMAAVATAWVLQKGASPILGLTSKERVDQSLQALKLKLTYDEMKYLEELYVPRSVQGY
jgi:aryl-alcohol dehydrogenase-like predicted oxidoreductase